MTEEQKAILLTDIRSEYSIKMAVKTNAQLQDYVIRADRYQDRSVIAAIEELIERKRNSDRDIKIKDQLLEGICNKNLNNSVETDDVTPIKENAFLPELYNPGLIRAFGILFSVFVGSILMALNLIRMGHKKIAIRAVLFGLFYSVTENVALNLVASSITSPLLITVVGLGLSFLGVILLERYFWYKYVPATMEYKRRSPIPPIVICVGIALVIIYILKSNGILVPGITS